MNFTSGPGVAPHQENQVEVSKEALSSNWKYVTEFFKQNKELQDQVNLFFQLLQQGEFDPSLLDANEDREKIIEISETLALFLKEDPDTTKRLWEFLTEKANSQIVTNKYNTI